MFGLKDKDIADIKNVLENFPEVEEAFVFGSRALGTYRNGSDVDVAIKGSGAGHRTARRIAGILNEETLMPYHFDVLSYPNLKNEDLLGHIDRVGKLLYTANNTFVVNEPSSEYKKRKDSE